MLACHWNNLLSLILLETTRHVLAILGLQSMHAHIDILCGVTVLVAVDKLKYLYTPAQKLLPSTGYYEAAMMGLGISDYNRELCILHFIYIIHIHCQELLAICPPL